MNLRLRTIEDFFTAPNLDPLSDWFEVYSLTSGIELVLDEVGDEPRVSHVDATIRDRSRVRVEAIPPEATPRPEAARRTRSAGSGWDSPTARRCGPSKAVLPSRQPERGRTGPLKHASAPVPARGQGDGDIALSFDMYEGAA